MVRVKDVYDGHVTIKFVFIQIQSDKIKNMVKASLSTHKGTVDKMFAPIHVRMPVATTIDDFSQDSVEETVQKNSNTKSSVIDGDKKVEKKVEKKEEKKKKMMKIKQ